MSDPHDLKRFVDAQNPLFDQVRAELKAGRKRGHWMWFMFPQLKGLGSSQMATHYGIASREEAQAYLNHPVLGPRLKELTGLVNNIEGSSISEIMGDPDDLKFHSSMTLFSSVTTDNQVFQEALRKYFDGELDSRTLQLL
jgi:uncharacterized protein (DUF1810 family)